MTRWLITISTPSRTWSLELPHGRASVIGDGAALDVPRAGLAARHCSVLPRDEGVILERLRDGEVLVNDVAVSSQLTVGHGDEVRLAEARLVFARLPALSAPRARVARHEEFMVRLADELARAGVHRPVGLALVSAPGLNVAARQALLRRVLDELHRTPFVPCVGEVASDLFALLVPEAPLGALDALWARLPEVVGPRGRVSLAQGPRDGLDAETLLGRAWHRLLGEDRLAAEPVLADPVMVRLAALGERLAEMEGAVCAVGPAGSGRATLLRALAAAAGRRVFECSALDAEALAGAAARSPDWTLVRDSDQAPEAVAALLRRARGRVLATAASRPAAGAFPHVFEVPPLHARVEDVLPLAEAFVAASRQAAGRPRLTLGAEARALLKAWRWPGNVRELENALWRAARVSVRDEIGPDALPAALGAEARPEDLRGALKSAERELLLEALARTRWNVTAAAARLGLPRRTVVYRMAKLGLRRPAR